MMGMKTKHTFSLYQQDNFWGIMVDGKYPLKSRKRINPLYFRDKGILEYIIRQLNKINNPNLRDGVFIDRTCRSLEFIEEVVENGLLKKDETFWKDFVENNLKNESVFSLSKNQTLKGSQKAAYRPVHSFLEKNNLAFQEEYFDYNKMVLKNADFIEKLNKLVFEKLNSLSVKRKCAIYYMSTYWSLFQHNTRKEKSILLTTLLFFDNTLTKEDYIKIMMCAAEEIYSGPDSADSIYLRVLNAVIGELSDFLKYWEATDE